MANQLSSILNAWYPAKDDCDWVLGAVYKTEGPCYRKAGAMMMFNSLGQQFGMLSGGCLESDIQTHARKVMQTGNSLLLSYDGSDEDDLSFRLGIGCGGSVFIVLHPVHASNDYLQLERLWQGMQQRERAIFRLPVIEAAAERVPPAEYRTAACAVGSRAVFEKEGATWWLSNPVEPDPHLLVVGGGIDARPVVTIAKQLGWQVSVWDPRPANARREFFMDADYLLRDPVDTLPEYVKDKQISAAVMMSHSVTLDAAALAQLNGVGLSYMALLGPLSRKRQVMAEAGLGAEGHGLKQPLSGPAGLDIGGELPESIALSILAECHARLHAAGRINQPDELAA